MDSKSIYSNLHFQTFSMRLKTVAHFPDSIISYVKMTRFITTSLFFATACSTIHKDNIVIEKIKSNSHLLTDSIITLDGIKINQLKEVDTIVFNSLKRNNLFNPESCNGCKFWVYYYGHFNNRSNYLSAVFGKETMTAEGTEELIMVNIDNDGNIIDVMTVALNDSPSECTMTEMTKMQQNELLIYHKTTCAVFLADKNDYGENIDSTINNYTISKNGKFIFRSGTSGKAYDLPEK